MLILDISVEQLAKLYVAVILLAISMTSIIVSSCATGCYNTIYQRENMIPKDSSAIYSSIVYIGQDYRLAKELRISHRLSLKQARSNIMGKQDYAIYVIDIRHCDNTLDSLHKLVNKIISYDKPIILIGSPEKILKIISSTNTAVFAIPAYEISIENGIEVKKELDEVAYGFIPTGTVNGRVTGIIISDIGNDLPSSTKRVLNKILTDMREHGEYNALEKTYLGQLDITYTKQPYGRINIRDILYWLTDDGNNEYNWFPYEFNDQIIPGCNLWNNDWKNADLKQTIDVDYGNPQNFLSLYDPTTYVGSTQVTVSVNLGLSTGYDRDGVQVGQEVQIGVSWTYSKPDIVIHDQSDYSEEKASWWNDIDESKDVGSSTVLLRPGALIRLPQSPGTYTWMTTYLGQWAHWVDPSWWPGDEYWETSGYYGISVIWGVVGT